MEQAKKKEELERRLQVCCTSICSDNIVERFAYFSTIVLLYSISCTSCKLDYQVQGYS